MLVRLVRKRRACKAVQLMCWQAFTQLFGGWRPFATLQNFPSLIRIYLVILGTRSHYVPPAVAVHIMLDEHPPAP
jgi:hypothetical protein